MFYTMYFYLRHIYIALACRCTVMFEIYVCSITLTPDHTYLVSEDDAPFPDLVLPVCLLDAGITQHSRSRRNASGC